MRAKRVFKRLTIRRILTLFAGGKYRLDFEELEVLSKRQNGEYAPICQDKCHRGYPFVRLHYRNARRAIAIHKLAWIVAHKRDVPKWHEIHHENSRKWDWQLSNLKLLTKKKHQNLTLQRNRVEFAPVELDDF